MEPWSQRLEVGVPEMDQAHRGLDQLMQAAIEAVGLRSAPAAESALASYLDAVRAHFTAEEAMMQPCDYREAAEHVAAHAAYLQEIEVARQQLAREGVSPIFQLWFGSRLAPWLRLHFRGLDTRLARQHRAWQEKSSKAPAP